jgi:hypothetical protein
MVLFSEFGIQCAVLVGLCRVISWMRFGSRRGFLLSFLLLLLVVVMWNDEKNKNKKKVLYVGEYTM